MFSAASGSMPAVVTPKAGARGLNIHVFLLLFCLYAVGSRLLTVASSGGWEDRTQFFIEGELRPGLVDFFFNEVMVYYLLTRVLVYRFSISVCAMLIASGFAYYTRVPIILMFFAIVLSAGIGARLKLWAGLATLVISFVLLYLRIGEDLLYSENSSIFYITYPMIGLARLLQTTQGLDVNAWHYATLIFKPLDAVMFLVDYLGMYAGQLSAGRFSGLELSQFEYIQSLQGAYNAFGSIAYPFVYVAGWAAGIPLFLLFLVGQYILYIFATQSKTLTKRFILFMLVTGILFSWTSPFVWLVPLLFTQVRGRSTDRLNLGRTSRSASLLDAGR